MTETATETARDAGRDVRWSTSPRVALLAAAAAGLLALGVCLHQLSLPGVLHGVDEYDDGFYLGTVMRLVNGTLPYKDFVYPQPPGLPLLMAPLGLLGRVIGTRALMADIRVLTAFVSAANAGLVAYLLRRRGVVPALIGGVALALYPLAVTADKTLMLEPYLVFSCLIAACTMFSGDELAGRRRLLFAGVAFGFACTLKLWAVLPAGVAIACCVPKWRSQVRPVVTGFLCGSIIPSLPFFLLAPSDFLHDLVAIQFLRHHAPETTSAADRLMYVTGITGLPSIHATHTLAIVIAVVFVALVVTAFAAPMRRTTLDWFVLGAATLGVAAMFVSPDFHFHYTYFAAAFAALLIGVTCDRVSRFVGSIAPPRLRPDAASRPFVPGVAIVLVAAVCVWGVSQEARYLRQNPGIVTVGEQSASVQDLIPKGACTITDEPARTLVADRFVPDRSSCPAIVDTFSTWISYDPDVLPPSFGPYDPTLVAAWRSWLAASDYAVFSAARPFRIPWSAELNAWFEQNYRMISQTYDVYVFQFVGQRES